MPRHLPISAMPLLHTTPAFIVNLARRPERRLQSVRMARHELRPGNVSVVEAVDGRGLLKAGGRVREMEHNIIRLAWNTEKERAVFSLRAGTAVSSGLGDPWGMVGCIQSHLVVLRRALKLFDKGVCQQATLTCRYITLANSQCIPRVFTRQKY